MLKYAEYILGIAAINPRAPHRILLDHGPSGAGNHANVYRCRSRQINSWIRYQPGCKLSNLYFLPFRTTKAVLSLNLSIAQINRKCPQLPIKKPTPKLHLPSNNFRDEYFGFIRK